MRAVERFSLAAPSGPTEPLAPGAMPRVAYFSPEFGLSADLPQYSGGLGVLAGDYLRECAAEKQPLVGVGLFYRLGYFHQSLARDGWQQESYRELTPDECGLSQLAEEPIELALAGATLRARVWRKRVDGVVLYLLDTYGAGNPKPLESITDRLYGGDTEHRLQQEILLGMGGVEALRRAGAEAELFHSNEGHAGFNVLQRVEEGMTRYALGFDEALELARTRTVFTTHTPVPAGIDHFPRELMERYFSRWCERAGIPLERLLALGHFPGEPADAPFNMAVLGLRTSARANAVSRLHQAVSRRMFAGLWPGLQWQEVPIEAVTNGVHPGHWVAEEVAHLLVRYLGPRWERHQGSDWNRLRALAPRELWDARRPGRERLIAAARSRLAASVERRGADPGYAAQVLDPSALTIGFARRVAEYKRAGLLFSQPERLRRLLLNPKRPVQLVMAGKAHPADDRGKEIIRGLAEAIEDQELRRRVVFLEDYDIDLARTMYQGADVWLNTPRRPMEACGTSGQKAALNGALNCSILDGWWDEAYNGENGFAIGSHEEEADLHRRDQMEADELFELLESSVVPLFFERDGEGIPARWLGMVQCSLMTVGPLVLGSRMVADYADRIYRPTLAGATGTGPERVAAEVRSRRLLHSQWSDVSVEASSVPESADGWRRVEAVVVLGTLSPDSVQVELVHGPVDPAGLISGAAAEPMHTVGGERGALRYQGSFRAHGGGEYGFTVRVMPRLEPGLGPPAGVPVRWARRLRPIR